MKKIKVKNFQIHPYSEIVIDIPSWCRYILFKNVNYPLKARFDFELEQNFHYITENTILDTNLEYRRMILAPRLFLEFQVPQVILKYVCDIYFLIEQIYINEDYIKFFLTFNGLAAGQKTITYTLYTNELQELFFKNIYIENAELLKIEILEFEQQNAIFKKENIINELFHLDIFFKRQIFHNVNTLYQRDILIKITNLVSSQLPYKFTLNVLVK